MSAKWLTSKEMAAKLGTTTRNLRRLVAEGKLPAMRFGKRVMFDLEEVAKRGQENFMRTVADS